MVSKELVPNLSEEAYLQFSYGWEMINQITAMGTDENFFKLSSILLSTAKEEKIQVEATSSPEKIYEQLSNNLCTAENIKKINSNISFVFYSVMEDFFCAQCEPIIRSFNYAGISSNEAKQFLEGFLAAL